MLKNKRILLCIIFAIALFLIPNMCNAAVIPATETTETSTGKIVKWSYELDKNDEIIKLLCTNKNSISGSVVIPETIDGKTVRIIGNPGGYSWDDSTFYGCTGLTGVTLPNTVSNIANYSFAGCVGLKSIIIPNEVTSIGNNAFSGCTGITSVTFNECLLTIGEAAFSGCTGIKSISIPNSVGTIGESAFYGCAGIKNLVLPDSVTSVGNSAFEGCTGIKNLVLPDSVTIVGNSAFEGCTGINSLTLSKSLTKIAKETFKDCTGLTSVVIPDSVTTIDGDDRYDNIYGAFEGCTNLTKVLIPDSVATIMKSVFYKCSKLTIYGNDGQLSKQYAEDNKIKFDYIKNWDKPTAGEDITAPTVESMQINCSNLSDYYDTNSSTYKIPANIQTTIKVKFSEEIKGGTAPTLVIKCGAGNDITLTNGQISSPIITYSYTIKTDDVGQIIVKSFSGGDIADLVGNNADLTIKKLTAGYQGNQTAYANGTISNQGGNNDDGGNTQNPPATVTLSSIAITKAPTKVSYTEDEKFDKTGMVITATYSDGTKKEITNYSINLTEGLKTTDTKAVITYTEKNVTKTVEQTITVKAKEQKPATITLSSIKITKTPTKTKYIEGEKFDKTGMTVTATYSDGTTKTITNYSVSLSEKLKTTDKKVTITYTENGVTKTVDQAISVAKDTTIKGDNKMPQTGAALLSLALVSLIAVAVISKLKYGKYKEI